MIHVRIPFIAESVNMLMSYLWSFFRVDQNGLLAGEAEGRNGDAVEAMDTGETDQQEKTATARPALRMSFAEYRRISNLLVLHMQKMEQCESLIHR